MASASTRLRRVALAFSTAVLALMASPLSGTVAAEDNGLGAGGAGFAFNFTLVVGIVLAFIFGFAMRDYFGKRALRARSAKKPTPAPPRN